MPQLCFLTPPPQLLPDLLKPQSHFLSFKDALGSPPSPNPSVGKTYFQNLSKPKVK